MMLNLIGSRSISKQESCHLALGIPMVSCSHQFVRINLTSSLKKLSLKKKRNCEDDDDLEKPSILDMYMIRTDVKIWDSQYEMDSFQNYQNLSTMSLYEFAKLFYVRRKLSSEVNYHITKHRKENMVIMFTPVFSTDPAGSNYHEFCRLNLIKFRPFVGCVENAYENITVEKEIIDMWESFSKRLLETGKIVPGSLRRDFERVSNYNEKNKKRKRKEENSYVNDFEEPEDLIVKENVEDDVVIFSLTGDFNKDYDAQEEIVFKWDRAHDFSEKVQTYSTSTNFNKLGDDFTEYLETKFSRRVVRRNVSPDTLKPSQRLAHDVLVRMATREPGTSKTDIPDSRENGRLCILFGKGGAGKSYTIDCILSTLRNKYDFEEDDYLILATSAIAASVIGGVTVHSPAYGLGIPIGNKYVEVKGKDLRKYQTRLKNLKFLIIDEFSMLGQKALYFVSERLKQIMANSTVFGGVCVILIGDPGQLPPVNQSALWIENMTHKNAETRNGCILYKGFSECLFLKENNRLDENDLDSVNFDRILGNIRNGKISENDCEEIRNKCSRFRMGLDEFKTRGFEDDGITHLFSTNDEAAKLNDSQLLKLQQGVTKRKIVRITAENSTGARSYGYEHARRLANELFLCVDAKVMLFHNLKQDSNLVNGSVGYVKEIVYEEGKLPPSLPSYVIVDFGEFYTGRRFFEDTETERKGWVPIKPTTVEWYGPNSKTTYTRKQLPLKLAWAITIHKCQGITIPGKYCVDLGTRERNHGMTYVAMSRATKFSDIGLISPLTGTRVNAINNNKANKERIEHERQLEILSKITERTYRELVD